MEELQKLYAIAKPYLDRSGSVDSYQKISQSKIKEKEKDTNDTEDVDSFVNGKFNQDLLMHKDDRSNKKQNEAPKRHTAAASDQNKVSARKYRDQGSNAKPSNSVNSSPLPAAAAGIPGKRKKSDRLQRDKIAGDPCSLTNQGESIDPPRLLSASSGNGSAADLPIAKASKRPKGEFLDLLQKALVDSESSLPELQRKRVHLRLRDLYRMSSTESDASVRRHISELESLPWKLRIEFAKQQAEKERDLTVRHELISAIERLQKALSSCSNHYHSKRPVDFRNERCLSETVFFELLACFAQHSTAAAGAETESEKEMDCLLLEKLKHLTQEASVNKETGLGPARPFRVSEQKFPTLSSSSSSSKSELMMTFYDIFNPRLARLHLTFRESMRDKVDLVIMDLQDRFAMLYQEWKAKPSRQSLEKFLETLPRKLTKKFTGFCPNYINNIRIAFIKEIRTVLTAFPTSYPDASRFNGIYEQFRKKKQIDLDQRTALLQQILQLAHGSLHMPSMADDEA